VCVPSIDGEGGRFPFRVFRETKERGHSSKVVLLSRYTGLIMVKFDPRGSVFPFGNTDTPGGVRTIAYLSSLVQTLASEGITIQVGVTASTVVSKGVLSEQSFETLVGSTAGRLEMEFALAMTQLFVLIPPRAQGALLQSELPFEALKNLVQVHADDLLGSPYKDV
jgi:hypothetical protein